MNEIKLLSVCHRTKDINWEDTIYVDKIMFDKNLFNAHKERIDKVFASAPAEVKEQQLQNILMRDTLFNKAMDKIVKCYEFELKSEDVDKYVKLITPNIPKDDTMPPEEQLKRVTQIAEKLIQKELVFNDIANVYNIAVDAQEALSILDDYNKTTGNSIDDITSDKIKLTGAVNALLEEKITAFIINKFSKNFDELQKNMQIDSENRKKQEEADAIAATKELNKPDKDIKN